ncbi:hypothetical protein ACFLWO_04700, partial [Chloroflexota bacterium]
MADSKLFNYSCLVTELHYIAQFNNVVKYLKALWKEFIKMKSSNRWLYIFGTVIGVMVIITVLLALTIGSPSEEALLGEETPEGTLQRFLLAVRDRDYLTAETYFSPSEDDKTDFELLRNRPAVSGENPAWKVTMGNTIINDDEATV